MNDVSPPIADQLGVSDGQYERIMRDLQRRQAAAAPQAPPPGRRKGGASRTVVLTILGLIVAVKVVAHVAGPGAADGPTYAFLQTRDDVHPVTYSSCRPIQVAVYPAGGPSDAEELVREAVTKVRAATGSDISVIGAFGGHAPNWNFEASPITPVDPISVSWQDGDALAEMTDDVAGLGGSPTITSAYGIPYRVAGTIALSRDYYQQIDHDEALAVLLHEFGHVFGLDHVDSSDELMYHDNIGRTSYGAGDLAGLRILGHGPCVS